jgi:hypothetical protein
MSKSAPKVYKKALRLPKTHKTGIQKTKVSLVKKVFSKYNH